MKAVMKIVAILAVLACLPPTGWAQQAETVELIGQLLARETRCFARPSMRLLDSSQLSAPPASFRLAGLRQIAGDGYLATVLCAGAAVCLPFVGAFRCNGAAAAAVDRPRRSPQPKRGTAVRPGDRARLEMTITGAKLSFPVICLEGGDVGEVIRTRAVATDRIFPAMVTGPRQLRGVEAEQ